MTAEEFFYQHAGWSYLPGSETPEEGRRRCAKELAQAETWAKERGLVFVWEPDWSIPSHVEEYPDAYETEPETCEVCIAYEGEEVVASLGCIDDASPEYRRAVEAELADEWRYQVA